MPKKTIVRITWSCIYCADEIRHGAKLFDFTQRDSEVKNAFFARMESGWFPYIYMGQNFCICSIRIRWVKCTPKTFRVVAFSSNFFSFKSGHYGTHGVNMCFFRPIYAWMLTALGGDALSAIAHIASKTNCVRRKRELWKPISIALHLNALWTTCIRNENANRPN